MPSQETKYRPVLDKPKIDYEQPSKPLEQLDRRIGYQSLEVVNSFDRTIRKPQTSDYMYIQLQPSNPVLHQRNDVELSSL